MDLNNLEDSKAFYDRRYLDGYMEEWPADKKARVRELIRSLPLPAKGRALDFGCGNGVFTRVLKDALPEWEVSGCDISEAGLNNAKKAVTDCNFFVNADPTFASATFDFVFSHHVLEHVFDIKKLAEEISARCAPRAAMLHILPCGNQGSFEWRLCNLRSDGINAQMENRFFFEDPGHIRRLDTARSEVLFKDFGFVLADGFYANQRAGVINWVTRSNPLLIPKMFNPFKGKNPLAGLKLFGWLVEFSLVSWLRLPYLLEQRFKASLLARILLFLPARPSACLDAMLVRRAEKEWAEEKKNPAGSEMYLFFIRDIQ
jgi:SAM-dependent methyltransferase